jgi:phosphoglycerate dehydrogenase-like enzyme
VTSNAFPAKSEITICFAHVAYQMEATFQKYRTGMRHVQAWSVEQTKERLPDSDVLVISGLWRNEFLNHARRLRFIQSIGAGVDQFPLEELKKHEIRLASASGVNRNAVSEHVFALILALARKIHDARDNQRRHFWRPMIAEIPAREDELAGKTLGIVGLGRIGSRVAALGKAFGMHIIATKQRVDNYEGPADKVLPAQRAHDLLKESDFVVVTCALTPETRGIIDREALAAMKSSAFLINVARGQCVDQPALVEALRTGVIAGAGLDTFWDEPLAADSAIWDLANVVVTPHSAGETQKYESNVIDILLENLKRLWRGEHGLLNQIV